eukprot:TRINITY_DN160_c1_g1_i9.p1 TRINITY_DN160_c1_g1~~TRINITY_DN160_c1_g1_i9.p1  ORF type:complete len:370 (+),score=74.60 TRINITY_DN160_c1_g1_i9:506-1615(+)
MWGGASCVNNSIPTNPCNNITCPNGTHCITSSWGASCVNNTRDPCTQKKCSTGQVCVVTATGTPQCMNGKTCADISCTGSVCVYSSSGTPKCMKETDKCSNVKCAKDTTCTVSKWGVPECMKDTTVCVDVKCPEGTYCFANGTVAQCKNNEGPCDGVECPMNSACIADKWGRPVCSETTKKATTNTDKKIVKPSCGKCKEGTKCGLNEQGLTECLVVEDLCSTAKCGGGMTCVVNQWGSTQCVSPAASLQCGKISCEAQSHCRLGSDGFALCAVNRGPCDNTVCVVGKTCMVDVWGRAVCRQEVSAPSSSSSTFSIVIGISCGVAFVAAVAVVVGLVMRKPSAASNGVLGLYEEAPEELLIDSPPENRV